MFVINSGGIVWGTQFVPSGMVALLNATTALWTAILAVVWLKDTLTPARWLGVGVGIVGVTTLVDAGVEGRDRGRVPARRGVACDSRRKPFAPRRIAVWAHRRGPPRRLGVCRPSGGGLPTVLLGLVRGTPLV